MFCYVHKSSEKCFFCKKNVHGLLHFASINYKKPYNSSNGDEKKSKEGAQKKCRFTEKRLFYTCDDNVELVPANVIFLDSRPKAFLGAHPKALCVKRIESKMHPPTNPFHPSNDLSR